MNIFELILILQIFASILMGNFALYQLCSHSIHVIAERGGEVENTLFSDVKMIYFALIGMIELLVIIIFIISVFLIKKMINGDNLGSMIGAMSGVNIFLFGSLYILGQLGIKYFDGLRYNPQVVKNTYIFVLASAGMIELVCLGSLGNILLNLL